MAGTRPSECGTRRAPGRRCTSACLHPVRLNVMLTHNACSVTHVHSIHLQRSTSLSPANKGLYQLSVRSAARGMDGPTAATP